MCIHNITATAQGGSIPVNAGTLVVPSEHENVLWILHLVRQNKTNCLQRHLTPENNIVQNHSVLCVCECEAHLST